MMSQIIAVDAMAGRHDLNFGQATGVYCRFSQWCFQRYFYDIDSFILAEVITHRLYRSLYHAEYILRYSSQRLVTRIRQHASQDAREAFMIFQQGNHGIIFCCCRAAQRQARSAWWFAALPGVFTLGDGCRWCFIYLFYHFIYFIYLFIVNIYLRHVFTKATTLPKLMFFHFITGTLLCQSFIIAFELLFIIYWIILYIMSYNVTLL